MEILADLLEHGADSVASKNLQKVHRIDSPFLPRSLMRKNDDAVAAERLFSRGGLPAG